MALSFPYPTLGTTIRPAGQGCQSCIHKNYCPAMYWLRRYTSEQRPVDDAHLGKACNSWSTDPADTPTGADNTDDNAHEERMYNEGIGSEPNRNGITAPTTGKSN